MATTPAATSAIGQLGSLGQMPDGLERIQNNWPVNPPIIARNAHQVSLPGRRACRVSAPEISASRLVVARRLRTRQDPPRWSARMTRAVSFKQFVLALPCRKRGVRLRQRAAPAPANGGPADAALQRVAPGAARGSPRGACAPPMITTTRDTRRTSCRLATPIGPRAVAPPAICRKSSPRALPPSPALAHGRGSEDALVGWRPLPAAEDGGCRRPRTARMEAQRLRRRRIRGTRRAAGSAEVRSVLGDSRAAQRVRGSPVRVTADEKRRRESRWRRTNSRLCSEGASAAFQSKGAISIPCDQVNGNSPPGQSVLASVLAQASHMRRLRRHGNHLGPLQNIHMHAPSCAPVSQLSLFRSAGIASPHLPPHLRWSTPLRTLPSTMSVNQR